MAEIIPGSGINMILAKYIIDEVLRYIPACWVNFYMILNIADDFECDLQLNYKNINSNFPKFVQMWGKFIPDPGINS